MYNRLLFQEWWSNSLGVTDLTGRFERPVFKGAYQITVIGPNGPQTQVVTVADSRTVAITLP